MNMAAKPGTDNVFAALNGQTIESADSSLTKFALRFADGQVLLIEAAGDPQFPSVALTLSSKDVVPALAEAVCTVDWTWIAGSRIESVRLSTGRLSIKLDPAGPLEVSALVWQGAPFLSFMPYKPAART